jgi:two-component system response regulator
VNEHPRTCILQVEDDEGDVLLLRHAFETVGITNPVRLARDGQMAIDYLGGVGEFANRDLYPEPCLVLLDLKLPRLDGFQVLEWIAQQPKWKHLAVVVFSSSALTRDIERAYALGANSYIEKPSDFDRLRDVTQLLKGWWLGYNHFAPLYTPRADPC